MKKVIYLSFVIVGIFLNSTVSAQVPVPTHVENGCPDDYNVNIGPNVILVNCNDCNQYSSGGMSPHYTCPPDETFKIGKCIKCFKLYDNLTIDDVVVNVVVIPAVQRAWIYTVVTDDGNGVWTIDIEDEIDYEHLQTILNPGP